MTDHAQATSSFIQIVVCRAREGVAHDSVLRLSDTLQRWVERQPGFVRRRLVSTGDAGYVDIVEWKDRDAAEASTKSPDHPDGAEMGKVLALDSMTFVQGPVV
jgi:hypothetical protein